MRPSLWRKLLWLRQQVNLAGETFQFCSFDIDTDELPLINEMKTQPDAGGRQVVVFINQLHIPQQKVASIRLDSNFNLEIKKPGQLDQDDLRTLKIYLPYCFLSLLAIRENRAIAIAHFAQSLDGKIATFSGDSKWIGNDENLKHAHRMRALTDGILIGSGTLRNDKPRLNVRLVEGDNPKRIILGSPRQEEYKCLTEASADAVLVIGKENEQVTDELQFIALATDGDNIPCKRILECLFQQGVYTVYIEGGAITTSNFLKENAIDVFQLHLSPRIFGSGKQGIQLPQIEEVKEAIHFEKFSFEPIGDTMMFVGRLNFLEA